MRKAYTPDLGDFELVLFIAVVVATAMFLAR